jgi:RNA polymerase sigma-70 factor (ECF subfamily)
MASTLSLSRCLGPAGDGAALDDSAREGLDAALAEVWSRAQAEHPELAQAFGAEAFVRYLGERLPPAEVSAQAVSLVHGPDLLLAFAVLQGHALALRAFEHGPLAGIRGSVARLCQRDDELLEDALQAVRENVLVSSTARLPKLAEYTGRGPLGAWLRVVASGVTLNLARQRRPDAPTPEGTVASGLWAGKDDLEAGLLNLRYAQEFKDAFREAVKGLSDRERTVLKLKFVDGLKGEQIARMYNVHGTTALRWLEKAQAQVQERTRALLAEKLRVTGSEADSLVDALMSQVDLSLSRYLA